MLFFNRPLLSQQQYPQRNTPATQPSLTAGFHVPVACPDSKPSTAVPERHFDLTGLPACFDASTFNFVSSPFVPWCDPLARPPEKSHRKIARTQSAHLSPREISGRRGVR